MKSLLLLALGLARTVVLGARIEAERIVVSVRPYKREQRRCPVCGRACDFYDMANRGAPRLWRAMDLARSACYLEYAPCRVRCPEHGVRTEAVPGRDTGRASRATSRTGWRGWRSAAPPRRSPSSPASSGTAWAARAGASTPSWRPRAAPRGSTACAASASTRRRTRGATSTSRCRRRRPRLPHLGARGHRQGRAQPVPRRAHARAEARHRGGDRRRREVDRQLVKRRRPNARWVMDPFHVVQWTTTRLMLCAARSGTPPGPPPGPPGPGPRASAAGLPKASCRPRRSGRSRRRRPPSRAAATRS